MEDIGRHAAAGGRGKGDTAIAEEEGGEEETRNPHPEEG